MKLAAILNNRYSEIENRKRMLKQKNADEAYKKNAQFFQPTSNPALEELVDLLTGKKEKQNEPELKHAIRTIQEQQLEMPEDPKVEQLIASSMNEEPVSIMKRIQQSALSNANPTIQDLAVANSAASYIANHIGSSSVAERELSSQEEQVQTAEQPKELVSFEKIQRARLFAQATSTYQQQAQMARRGYPLNQPTFYQSA